MEQETPDDGLDRSDHPDSEDRKWQSIKKNSTTSFSEHGADSEDERRRRSESRAYSEQSEFNSLMHEASASNTGCSSPMEVPDSLCSSPRGNFPPQITVRRSSAGNVSSLSGPECSESSSLNEAVSLALRLPNRRWRAASSTSSSDNDDNYSTSSDSSFLEDIPVNRKSWSRHRLHRQERTEIPREEEGECTYYIPIIEKKDSEDVVKEVPREDTTSEDVTPKISNASQNEFVPDETYTAKENKECEVKFKRPNFDFFLTDDLATPTPHMERNWQFQTLSEPEPIPTYVTELETIPPVSVSPVKMEILPQSATATVEDVYSHPKTHPKYFFEPFTSLTDLNKPVVKVSQVVESQPVDINISKVSVKPKSVASFSSLKLSADSPVIKSRSPRRLKSDKDRNTSAFENNQSETSVSVTNLPSSDKYWPKVSIAQDKPATPPASDQTSEKITELTETIRYPIKIPITVEETAQKSTLTASAFSIKREAPINANSRARIQAQIKAKEEMLRNYELAKTITNVPPIETEQSKMEETPKGPKTIIHKIELEDSVDRKSPPRRPQDSKIVKETDEDSRKFRPEERKCATLDRQRPPPETEIVRSSSRGFLQGKMKKLHRSKQSESSSAVGALCRQSLFVAFDSQDKPEEPSLRLPQKSSSQSAIGAKSCPSSPETKPKSRSWFPKNIFKR